jgi:putative heme transporter
VDAIGDAEEKAPPDAEIEALEDVADEELGEKPGGRRRRRRVIILQCLAGAATIASLLFALQSHGGHFLESVRGLAHLRWGLVVLAVAAESASMAMFARMQRRLLRAGDFRVALVSVLAITYAGNAISGSIPIAGSEISVAFSYKEFERRGADRATAAVALVLSGVISSVTLATIVAVGALASGNGAAALGGVAGAAILVALAGTALLAWRNPRVERTFERFAVYLIGRTRRLTHRQGDEPAEVVAGAREELRRLHFSRLDGLFATVFGAGNWLGDVACLGLAIAATGLHLPGDRLILVWSAGSAAATLGLTPGGIGVVEVALVGALTAAGLPTAGAATAVLVYRSISFWAKLLIGLLIYAVLHRRSRVLLAA